MQIAWFLLAAVVSLSLVVPFTAERILRLRRTWRSLAGTGVAHDAESAAKTVVVPSDLVARSQEWDSQWARDGAIAAMQAEFVRLTRMAGMTPDQAWAAIRRDHLEEKAS